MGKKGKMPDMNLPIWFDGQNINEALFCEEFLRERRIIFANGAFFTPDGRVTDDLPLRGEIYDKLKFCAVNNIPRKITNILEVLKLEAQVPDFPPEQDRIHVANGTLLQNGTFTEGRPAIVRSRLPVAYNPDAPAPVVWLNFLDDLLHTEDIPTLQEFIGYCLIPSNKGQRMMVIKGNGGEGKSQIGAVLSAIFGMNMKDGSIGKISENRFARADLEHIFDLCIDGKGPEQIARILEEKQILTAKALYAKRKKKPMPERPYHWSNQSIVGILERQEYTGCTCNFKTYSKSYKLKKRIPNEPENMFYLPDTQEAIVSQAQFDRVQELRKNKRRPAKAERQGLFSGLLFCADCGGKLHFATSKSFEGKQDHYVCNNYKSNRGTCTAHYIREDVLREIVLERIRAVNEYIRSDVDGFQEEWLQCRRTDQERSIRDDKKKLEQAKKRLADLDVIISRLYEDYVLGNLNQDRYRKMSADYEAEQERLKLEIEVIEEWVEQREEMNDGLDAFIALTQKYVDVEELTQTIVNEYIKKIVVYAPDKSSGKRKQKVKIFFNFVDDVDIPVISEPIVTQITYERRKTA